MKARALTSPTRLYGLVSFGHRCILIAVTVIDSISDEKNRSLMGTNQEECVYGIPLPVGMILILTMYQ